MNVFTERLEVSRKQWRRAMEKLDKIDFEDKQSFSNIFQDIHTAAVNYSKKISAEITKSNSENSKNVLILEGRLVEGSKNFAESMLGMHWENTYGVAKGLEKWIPDKDKKDFEEWTKDLSALEAQKMKKTPPWLNPIAGLIGLNNRQRDLKRGAKRGYLLNQKALMVEDMAVNAFNKISDDINAKVTEIKKDMKDDYVSPWARKDKMY